MLGDYAQRCCDGRVTSSLLTLRYHKAVAIIHYSSTSCPGVCPGMDMDPCAAVHRGLHRRHHWRHIWRPGAGGRPRRLGLQRAQGACRALHILRGHRTLHILLSRHPACVLRFCLFTETLRAWPRQGCICIVCQPTAWVTLPLRLMPTGRWQLNVCVPGPWRYCSGALRNQRCLGYGPTQAGTHTVLCLQHTVAG